MEAPAGRGADLHVPTTVPTPIILPSRHQVISSGRTSRMRHHLQQLRERRERVPGHKLVNIWKRRGDTALDRFVSSLTPVRVHPHDGMGEALKPGDLLAEQPRVATLPPVRGDDDDRATRHTALSPSDGERPDRLSQPGAAGPVRDALTRGL